MNAKKIIIRGGVLTFLLSLFSIVISCSQTVSESDSEEIARIRNLLAQEKYIIHAGGWIVDSSGNKYSYTNSKDALENCYQKGNKVSEIDFRISSDDFLVCTHEWNMMYKDGVAAENAKMTKDVFLQHKTWGGFTSMYLGDLTDFLLKHPDFYFVTDIKDDNVTACKLLATFCPTLLDHFIIQIYHPNEYDSVRELGFRNIIFTLYAAKTEEREVDTLVEFAKTHELIGFTYWGSWSETYLDQFLQIGVPSYVHTINDKDERTAFLQAGVSAIYTDEVNNK